MLKAGVNSWVTWTCWRWWSYKTWEVIDTFTQCCLLEFLLKFSKWTFSDTMRISTKSHERGVLEESQVSFQLITACGNENIPAMNCISNLSLFHKFEFLQIEFSDKNSTRLSSGEKRLRVILKLFESHNAWVSQIYSFDFPLQPSGNAHIPPEKSYLSFHRCTADTPPYVTKFITLKWHESPLWKLHKFKIGDKTLRM